MKSISGELQTHFHSSVPCLAFTRDSYEAREEEDSRRFVKNGANNVSDAKNARWSRRERLRESRCTDAGKVDHPRSMIPGALRAEEATNRKVTGYLRNREPVSSIPTLRRGVSEITVPGTLSV